jgi:polyferredoxin
LQWLKRIRVAVAVIFSLAVSSLFLDIYNIVPLGVHTFVTSTQLIPVLMRTLVSFSLISIGLLFILALTLLFGRVYCSTICPLGVLQDVVIYIAKRINKRLWFKFKKPFYSVHYILLAVLLIAALFGSVIFLNLLEPFSNYGRILSDLGNPLGVLLNNAIAYIFELFNLLFIARIPFLHIDAVSVIIAVIFLGLIIYLSYVHGRLFCNLLCPAGALLGIISRFSLYKIVIDDGSCNECGMCEMVCKANCIESESKKIDFAACVGCFNCIHKCKPRGISYKWRWKKPQSVKKEFNANRRKIL